MNFLDCTSVVVRSQKTDIVTPLRHSGDLIRRASLKDELQIEGGTVHVPHSAESNKPNSSYLSTILYERSCNEAILTCD